MDKELKIHPVKAAKLLALSEEVIYHTRVYDQIGKALLANKTNVERLFREYLAEEGIPETAIDLTIEDTGVIKWKEQPK